MIGILGGTFNPIHFGHLRIALEVAETCNLEQVRFIPSAVPPHRQQPEASAEQRLQMVCLATADEARFVVDDRELKRQGSSYTVDTLRSLKQDFPQQTLTFIMGMDAFAHFQSWYDWESILALCHIIVVQRPEYDEIPQWCQSHVLSNSRELLEQAQGGILFLPVTALAVSATMIRSALKNQQSPRYLIPESVLNYINTHQLYR